MGCNFKVASIVIATLAITFSSLYLVKICVQTGYEEEQKIDDGGIVPPPKEEQTVEEPWAATPSTSVPTPTAHKTVQDRYAEINEKLHKKSTRSQRIVGIIVAIVSIITSFMIFGAVSDDHDYNQCKRHLIVPFFVFHSLITFIHAIAVVYFSITYRQYMDIILIPILVYIALILVAIIGISFVVTYYKSLSRRAGFSYAQMDDVQKPISEVKVPLA